MKKSIITTVLLLCCCGSLTAQTWEETLKKLATTVVDQATDGKMTEYALAGDWCYASPAVKFEGGDLLSTVGGTAIESTVAGKLAKAYERAGIRPGAARISFDKEHAFTLTIGQKELSGTYQYDGSTHVVTLAFAKGKYNLGSVPGHAYINGSDLQLVFPVTKLVNLVTTLGSKVSSLASVTTLLKKYEAVYIGFAFEK